MTVCTDNIGNASGISEFEMNKSASAREFVSNLINKIWQFDQIYVDHYRMHGLYIAHSF